jgi:hypothetical protein
MAFPATITLTINAVAKVLDRINQDNFGSTYRLRSDTELLTLKIRHSTDNKESDGISMERHNVFVEHIIFATVSTARFRSSYTMTIRGGDQQALSLAGNLAKAVGTWVSTTSYAAVDQLVVGQN